LLSSDDVVVESLAAGPVRVTRVADVVADRIRELILAGDLADGQRLPPKEVLMQQFRVSGIAMREALRILESEGLLTVQRGNQGGAVVHGPDAETAAYTVALVLRTRGTDVRDVLQAQGSIEPLCASLCARRPDRKKAVVPALRKLVDASTELIDAEEARFREILFLFHQAVVERCGNNSLTLMAGILESISIAMVKELADQSWDDFRSRAGRLRVIQIHAEICDLIEAGDDIRVGQVMAEHLVRNSSPKTMTGIDLAKPVDASLIRLNR
jgi:GntR family transcriptional repressor for pyruvate dehydrogenase complex